MISCRYMSAGIPTKDLMVDPGNAKKFVVISRGNRANLRLFDFLGKFSVSSFRDIPRGGYSIMLLAGGLRGHNSEPDESLSDCVRSYASRLCRDDDGRHLKLDVAVEQALLGDPGQCWAEQGRFRLLCHVTCSFVRLPECILPT